MLRSQIEIIESVELDVLANSASGMSVFIDVLENFAAYRELSERAGSDPKCAAAVADRIRQICTEPFDNNYEHPRDVALAAYLRTLDQAGGSDVKDSAVRVLKLGKTWWASKVATQILSKYVLIETSAPHTITQSFTAKTTSPKGAIDILPSSDNIYSLIEIRQPISPRTRNINVRTAGGFNTVALTLGHSSFSSKLRGAA